MESAPRNVPPAKLAGECSPVLRQALTLLLQAHDYALEVPRPAWDFAVEIESLRAVGVTDNDLRWLVCKGYVQHALETTPARQDRRTFRRSPRLRFTRKTCVVLTEAGAALARAACSDLAMDGKLSPPSKLEAGLETQPCWDAARRELRLGKQVVKQYRQPAPQQEAILAAFQEEGWPARIDDPLPPATDKDARHQLHTTINNLNRNQKQRLLRFSGDGKGSGVRWEFLF